MLAHNFSGIVSISLSASILPFFTLCTFIISQCLKGRLTYHPESLVFQANLVVEYNFSQLKISVHTLQVPGLSRTAFHSEF